MAIVDEGKNDLAQIKTVSIIQASAPGVIADTIYNVAGNLFWNGVQLDTSGITGSGAANRVAFWDSSNGLTFDNGLTWDNSTKRLGLGTTTPSVPLEVSGTSILTNPAGNSYNENIRLPPASGGYASIALGAVPGINGTGFGQWTFIRWPNSDGNKLSFRHNNSDHVTIRSNGDMGLRNDSPNFHLDVSGPADNTQIRWGADSTNSGGYLISTVASQAVMSGGTYYSSGAWTATASSAEIIDCSLGNINFTTDAGLGPGFTFTPTVRMRITSDGKVGIGTTTPHTILQVRQGADQNFTVTGPVLLGDGVTIASTNDAYTTNRGLELRGTTVQITCLEANPIVFVNNVGAPPAVTELMRITNGGNVGIGTASPSEKLHIVGNSLIQGRALVSKGADVVAASTITLGTGGNFFTITGNTNIDFITTTGWTVGSEITFEFSGTPTLLYNTGSPPGGTAALFLSGATDFICTAECILKFIYNGVVWKELSRTAF